MNTLTKEWLQNTITSIESARDEIPFGLDEDQNNMLTALKIALASLASLAAVSDERAAYELFMEKRFGESVDRRRAKNGDREYMAWDMALGWIIWCHRAAMLQAGNFRENKDSSTNNFRETSETSTNSPVTPARLPGGFTIEDAKELHEDLVRSHISQALSGEKMKKNDRDADLRWIHGVIVQAAWFVKASLEQNALSGNSPVTPDGWVMVPKRLTAENGAKGALSGEFSETTFISCLECFGDDDCDTCDGSGRIEIKVPVTWSTIKSIWDKGIEYFAAKPSQEVK